jgi:hypothetical protein
MRSVAVLSIIQSWPTAKISKKEITAILPLVRKSAHNPSATLAKKSKWRMLSQLAKSQSSERT